MINSVRLRTEPSVRQTEAILARIERDLTEHGAAVKRGTFGMLSFRVPPPWRALRSGLFLPITSGWVKVSAGAGELWRIRYELSFVTLRAITVVLSAALVAAGWTWPRLTLLSRLIGLWAVVYGAPWAAAAVHFRRLVEAGAREVVERRKAPRVGPASAG